MGKAEDIYSTLSNIKIEKYIKKKGKLDYLPWSHALHEIKLNYPLASYKVYENELGWNYHTDGLTCWVKVGAEIEGFEVVEYLPIMNFKNASIPKSDVTSVDVNKAIQRATVKAFARHGLGLSVYAGEDLPTETDKEVLEERRQNGILEIKMLLAKMDKKETDWVLKTSNVKEIDDIPMNAVIKIYKVLQAKSNDDS